MAPHTLSKRNNTANALTTVFLIHACASLGYWWSSHQEQRAQSKASCWGFVGFCRCFGYSCSKGWDKYALDRWNPLENTDLNTCNDKFRKIPKILFSVYKHPHRWKYTSNKQANNRFLWTGLCTTIWCIARLVNCYFGNANVVYKLSLQTENVVNCRYLALRH